MRVKWENILALGFLALIVASSVNRLTEQIEAIAKPTVYLFCPSLGAVSVNSLTTIGWTMAIPRAYSLPASPDCWLFFSRIAGKAASGESQSSSGYGALLTLAPIERSASGSRPPTKFSSSR